ncbi:MAG TPA: biotin/lipoyl-containing protein [Thermoplasmata archaeon]|jgi:pyruvate carboxylase subunit B
MRFRLVVDGEGHDVEVEPSSQGYAVRVDGAAYEVRTKTGPEGFQVRLGRRVHRIAFRGRFALVDGQAHDVIVASLEERTRATSGTMRGPAASIEVRPPMPGRVVLVPIREGSHVRRGDALAVLEAMKMQNEIPAPSDGIVRRVGVKEGESIGSDRVIAVIEATRGAA